MDKATLREAQHHIGEALVFVGAIKDGAEEKLEEYSEAGQADEAAATEEEIEWLLDIIAALESADTNIEEILKP